MLFSIKSSFKFPTLATPNEVDRVTKDWWWTTSLQRYLKAFCFDFACLMLVYHRGTPTWHSILGSKFVQNISRNVRFRKDLKPGEVSSLSISYNITISWLYTLSGFRIIFSLCDSATHEYIYFMATIIHTLWLAAEQELFYCNDRELWNFFLALRLSWVVSKAMSVWAKRTKKMDKVQLYFQ